MKNSEKDFLLFYDWYKIMKRLPATKFKALLCAMVDFQAEGVEPPEFSPKLNGIAILIFGQLERRKKAIENGKKGKAAQLLNRRDDF